VKHVLLLFLLLPLALSGCDSSEEVNAANPIVYGLTLQPSGFDPHIHRSSELGIVLRQVYDTLVYRDPEIREIVPGLADRWEIAENNLSYTFYLRSDVRFHDDTPFNAQAVGANLDRIIAEETASQRARFMLGPYQGYDIIDDYTIRIRLAQPFAPFLDSLSQVYLGIASPTALSEYSPLRYQYHQVGTGPYKFIEFTPGDKLVLRRNPDYRWGPSFYTAPDDNAIDEITYRFFTDPATRSTALESGEAQVMGEIEPSIANNLNTGGTAEVLPTAIPGLPLQFMFNTAQTPTDSLAVRQALIHATNRAVIIDTVFRGFSPIAWGPLSRETLYYDSSIEGTYAFNVEQARRLLDAAGYSDNDENGFLDDGNEDLTIVLIVPPWGLIPQVAQLIQDQWREVGINAQLEQVSGFPALREAVQSGDYHLVAFDSPGYDPYILNEFYLSSGANNFMNYNNAELDAALINAMRELAPNARRTQYAQIQGFIMDEALILPIRDYVNLNATVPAIDALRFDPYGWFPLMGEARYSEN
jgi:peptide/nickel transport system substrate-binding protein